MESREVARLAKRGLVNAQQLYEAWSKNWAAPPEYLATVSIARSVSRLGGVDKVTLEGNVGDVLYAAHGGMGRPAESLPRQGRFDIVVWNTWGPNGVVEVKTRGYSTLLRDVRRVCDALANAERIRWGLVAYLFAMDDGEGKEGKLRVADGTSSVAARASRIAARRRCTMRRHAGRARSREGGAWTAEVLEFRG